MLITLIIVIMIVITTSILVALKKRKKKSPKLKEKSSQARLQGLLIVGSSMCRDISQSTTVNITFRQWHWVNTIICFSEAAHNLPHNI